MKNKTRQNIGIITGFIIAMNGAYMLEPLRTRYFFGIFFLSAGMLISGICAYNYNLAEWADKLNDALQKDDK